MIQYLYSILLIFLSFHSIISRNVVTKPSLNRYMYDITPLYWKIGESDEFTSTCLTKKTFNSFPICMYRNHEGDIEAISDICIHRGASLSAGKLVTHEKQSKTCVKCPYHGWHFRKGKVENVPGTIQDYNIGVPKFKIYEHCNDVFLLPTYDDLSQRGNVSSISTVNAIYYPPEHFDNDFVVITGSMKIQANHKMITENVLDMMHVSYVHSFGNSLSPFPYKIKYDDIDELSGYTNYYYTSGQTSMSRILGNADYVKVENEFHLPDTTITRVHASDKMVKTIMTRCYPINENESILYYYLYRNFLELPIYDSLFHYQMTKTLREDVDVLKTVYSKYQNGFINNKYDITQVKYREKRNHFMKQFKLKNIKQK